MTSRTQLRTPSVVSVWAAILAVVLRGIRIGELIIRMPDGEEHRFLGDTSGSTARVDVRDPSFARRLLLGSNIALAEGYMDGSWDTPDLDALLDVGLANISAGWTASVPVVLRPVQRLVHALRDNDPSGGARRNVSQHYDLGNDFYELWLDETMTYSAGLFGGEAGALSTEELAGAQRRKWDRVLDLLQPASRSRILEIGCGWGGFAVHAAREAGCHVTGLTLSQEQAEFARARVREQGLDGLIDIRLQDYREVSGTFSGIASIEMFEAVGEKWWPVFFNRIRDVLAPGGAAGLQVITIADDRYDDYKHNPDFIQRYIFPGGQLPSPERFRAAAEATGLSVGPEHFFGTDYAKTLVAWAARFESVLPQVRALGFDERFIRMWRYYMAYCRAGFEQEAINVMQVRLEN